MTSGFKDLAVSKSNFTQRYIFTDQIIMFINLYKFVSYGTPHSSEGKEQIVNFPGFWGFFLT